MTTAKEKNKIQHYLSAGENIIIMCPTYCRAVYEWERLAQLPFWMAINKPQLTLTSIFGNTWKFVGETEGQRGLRGYHAEIISVDDLDWDKEETTCTQK